MKEQYILYGLVILAIIAAAYTFSGFVNTGAGQGIPDQKTPIPPNQESIESGSTGSGDVLVELTPHKAADGQLRVDIAANTHSVSLGQFDLKQMTTLEYNGKTIRPIQAPQLSGHHSSGTLLFDVDESIDAFTIRITGMPKVDERVFAWRG